MVATCWPSQIPRMDAVCGPPSIIEHMMPCGTGVNGSLAAASAAQAAAGCGRVPPTAWGPHVRVQLRGVAPGVAATLMISEAAGLGVVEPLLAAWPVLAG